MSSSFLALLLGGLAALFGMSGKSGDSDNEDDASTTGNAFSDPGLGSNSSSGGGATDVTSDTTPLAFEGSGGGSGGYAAPASPLRYGDENAGDETWAGPSAEEQLMVELINRARMDPQAEVDRLSEALAKGISSDPTHPLAITDALSIAALAHSLDMDDRDFFAHTNPDGESPGERALEAGHGTTYVSENIGWVGSISPYFNSQLRVEYHHEELWESDGHQRNLMDERWSEIGVGYAEGSHNGFNGSTFITENFSDRGINYLTGVVIEDYDDDEFYDIGEGQGDVQVSADDGDDVFSTTTWESGGYALALPPGTYEVTFEGGDLETTITTSVTIGQDNVKLDIIDEGGAPVALHNGSDVEVAEADVEAFLPEVEFDLNSIEVDDQEAEQEAEFV